MKTNSAFSNRARRLPTAWASKLLPPVVLLALPARMEAQLFYGAINNGTMTITGYNGPGGAVTIPAIIDGFPVTGIGFKAFSECGSLTNVTIPDSVTSIGDYAFAGCGLTSLTLGNHVTSIGAYAFSVCTGLGCVTIPGSVTNIGDWAFDACGLTNVTIPGSVTSIGDYAFSGCCGPFTVATQNPCYISLGGVLFNKSQTTLIQCPGRMAGAYAIPSSVTSIGDGAFSGCSGLTNVTIPGSVTNIGASGFWECNGLTSVTIPNSVTSIRGGGFYGCSGLTSVTIPNSVTTIGYGGFAACSGLTSAYFQGDGPSSFGAEVFDDTAANFSVYYPSSASGWSTPTWNGYPAQPYNYKPTTAQPLLFLIPDSGAVTPSFNHLLLGTNYQLQVSTDLSTWSNSRAPFTATNTSQPYPQSFPVAKLSQLFFRLQSSP